MPGFTIHIAVAKEYIKNHKDEIKDEREFIKGSIAPDLNEQMTDIEKNKNKSHYGIWHNFPLQINVKDFLNDENTDMTKDFFKGYLLHLLTDINFYNKYFSTETKEMKSSGNKFYKDYDCLNKFIIDKYDIEIIDIVKKYMNYYEGEPKYLKKDKIIKFIDEISKIDINTYIENIEYI